MTRNHARPPRPSSLFLVPAALCAALAVTGCSTAPKAASDSVTVVRTQAAQDSTYGEGYYRQGRYALALQFYLQSLSGYTSIDDAEGVIGSHIAIGKTYMAMGSLDMAGDMFTRARDRARAVSPALLFAATNSLGELALARGEAAQALAVFQEALAMPESARTEQQTALLYHNLGTAQKGLGASDEALAWYEKSLAINTKGRLYADAASNHYMIASVHSLRGDYVAARASAEQALALDKKVENSPGIAQDLYALGLIATRAGDSAAAFDYYQRSYLVSTTLGMGPQTVKALRALIDVADALGRASDAAVYRAALADLESAK